MKIKKAKDEKKLLIFLKKIKEKNVKQIQFHSQKRGHI